MVRFSLLVVAVALAAGTIGCAHCDTCDDFPTPCVSQNMGYSPPNGSYVASPPVVESTPTAAPGPGGATEAAPNTKPESTSPAAPPPSGTGSPHAASTELDPIPGPELSPPPPTTVGGLPRGEPR